MPHSCKPSVLKVGPSTVRCGKHGFVTCQVDGIPRGLRVDIRLIKVFMFRVCVWQSLLTCEKLREVLTAAALGIAKHGYGLCTIAFALICIYSPIIS